MKIGLTQHVVDRFHQRICPELTRVQAETRLREELLNATRIRERTKYGQLQYELPSKSLLIVKETGGDLVAVTIYHRKYRDETWKHLMAQIYDEFLAREAGILPPDPPVQTSATLVVNDQPRAKPSCPRQELLVSADTMLDQMRAYNKAMPALIHENANLLAQVEALKKRVAHHHDREESLFKTLKAVFKTTRTLQVLQSLGEWGPILIRETTQPKENP